MTRLNHPESVQNPRSSSKPSFFPVYWGVALVLWVAYVLILEPQMGIPAKDHAETVLDLAELDLPKLISTGPLWARVSVWAATALSVGICAFWRVASRSKPSRQSGIRVLSLPVLAVATLIPIVGCAHFIAGEMLRAKGFVPSENGWTANVTAVPISQHEFVSGHLLFRVEPSKGAEKVYVFLWMPPLPRFVEMLAFCGPTRRLGTAGLFLNLLSTVAVLALAYTLHFSRRSKCVSEDNPHTHQAKC